MTQYFRIMAYHPAGNFTAIIDSNGMFKTVDNFSSYLMTKGFNVIEAANDEQFLDVNIAKTEPLPDKVFLRSYIKGWFEDITYELNGIQYNAVKVGDKIYIPDRQNLCEEKKIIADKPIIAAEPIFVDKPKIAAEPKTEGTKPAGSYIKHYYQIKDENPGAIIFYRAGDFYEVLSPDAETVSIMLNLTLVSRDYGTDRIPMCGVPYHSVDSYIKKLIDFGFKVIVAEPAK